MRRPSGVANLALPAGASSRKYVSMDIRLLIDAIVRQTTVLIAQLATHGGARAPLAHVANQVFVDLAHNLHEAGISRKVGADMFGLALRTYQRKVQRLQESRTFRGRSLWQAILSKLRPDRAISQADVLTLFQADDPEVVRAVLNDLSESGLVFRSGTGLRSSYKAAQPNEEEPKTAEGGLRELVLAMIYREGPLSREVLTERTGDQEAALDHILRELLSSGRIMQTCEKDSSAPLYSAQEIIIAAGAPRGWEAAMFDHYASVVRTLCTKLVALEDRGDEAGVAAGSTYTYEVWPGHPYEVEVLETLPEYRLRNTALREKVAAWNAKNAPEGPVTKVTCYAGQLQVKVPWHCAVDEEPSQSNGKGGKFVTT